MQRSVNPPNGRHERCDYERPEPCSRGGEKTMCAATRPRDRCGVPAGARTDDPAPRGGSLRYVNRAPAEWGKLGRLRVEPIWWVFAALHPPYGLLGRRWRGFGRCGGAAVGWVKRSVTHQTGCAKDVIMSARSPAAEAAKRRCAPQREAARPMECAGRCTNGLPGPSRRIVALCEPCAGRVRRVWEACVLNQFGGFRCASPTLQLAGGCPRPAIARGRIGR